MSEGKDRLLAQMKDAEGAVYVLISGFTKEPYVECDKETYDDKVFVYMEEEAAKAKAEALKEEKIPVGAAKILSGHMLLFFTNLYTMGVNALEIHYKDKVDLIQIDEFAKRREDPQLEEGKQWIENPQLHLTALYFAQEVRRPKEVQDEKRMAQLQEEMAADFMKSRFIFALQQDGKGTPLVKLNTGDKYQLVFTDAVEFSRFNRNKAFKPVIVDAAQLPKVLDREVKGVVLNIMGVNLPLAVNRPAPAPQDPAARAQAAADQAIAAAASAALQRQAAEKKNSEEA